jgi:polar amino acid transport system substrate-binding protein
MLGQWQGSLLVRVCRGLLPLLLLATAYSHGAPLEVVADEWCPFNCQQGTAMPGYVVEVLQAVFAPDGITYRVLPWKRALLHAQRGDSAAAIGAIQDIVAAEHLQIGQEPVGYSADCLYVLAGNAVRFQGKADDLNPLKRVGIVLGYVYTEGFDQWLARPVNKPKIFIASGHQPAADNLAKLTTGSLDGMIEGRVVMDYLLRNAEFTKAVVSVGCNTPVPIYVAFGPKHSQSDALVRQLDQGLVALRSSGKLAEILAKYGLKDWQ